MSGFILGVIVIDLFLIESSKLIGYVRDYVRGYVRDYVIV